MRSLPRFGRSSPELTFVAAVALRFEAPRSVGETPQGVRFQFLLHGTVTGPRLNGRFPECAAYLVVDPDGIGAIDVRAPLVLNDGASAELVAQGRYDFGKDGFRRALASDLPNSALGWCPRFLTGHPRYQWLNRMVLLGIGQLVPPERRVDYDLFGIGTSASEKGPDAQSTSRSLYERLGGREGVDAIANDFLDALLWNDKLNQQNPKVAAAHGRLKSGEPRRIAGEVLSKLFSDLTGGPKEYQGRPLKEAHAPLDISNADWAISMMELVNVLNQRNVAERDREELVAVVEGTKSQIVTRK